METALTGLLVASELLYIYHKLMRSCAINVYIAMMIRVVGMQSQECILLNKAFT